MIHRHREARAKRECCGSMGDIAFTRVRRGVRASQLRLGRLRVIRIAADRKPEDVVKPLGVARVVVIGAFVFVFNRSALCGHRRLRFPSGVGSARVDGTNGGFGVGRFGEGEWQSQRHERGEKRKAEKFVAHSLCLRSRVSRPGRMLVSPIW